MALTELNGKDNLILIKKTAHIIGRAKDCDTYINRPDISRYHCIIKKGSSGKWYIKDTSLIGIKINNTPILKDKDHYLKNGDLISLTPYNSGFAYRFIYEEANNENVSTNTKYKETFDKETQIDMSELETSTSKTKSGWLNTVQFELSCAICLDLQSKSVILNCEHAFCNFCIKEWMLKKNTCPICISDITQTLSCSVIDNLVEYIVSQLDESEKSERNSTLKIREGILKKRNRSRTPYKRTTTA